MRHEQSPMAALKNSVEPTADSNMEQVLIGNYQP